MPVYYYQTAIGKIGIAEREGVITNLYLAADPFPTDPEMYETLLLREAAEQLESYLSGKLRKFSLPLKPAGTAFMQEVWAALCAIPYGETKSYKEIAVKIGSPKAARAVGLANNRNPIPIIIPCHRVIGSNGQLTGYRGGIAVKEQLLALELGQN